MSRRKRAQHTNTGGWNLVSHCGFFSRKIQHKNLALHVKAGRLLCLFVFLAPNLEKRATTLYFVAQDMVSCRV